MKHTKAASLYKILCEVGMINFDCINLWQSNTVYKQNAEETWTKGCILPFPKKSDLEITENHRGITWVAIAMKVYNALLLNDIWLEIREILKKQQNSFWRNHSIAYTFWQSVKSSNEYKQRTPGQHYSLWISPKHLIPYTEKRWSKYYLHIFFPKKPWQL